MSLFEVARILIAAVAVLSLPGAAWLALTASCSIRRSIVFDSVGLSLAIIPLLTLWSTLLGIRLDRPLLVWGLVLCAVVAILRLTLRHCSWHLRNTVRHLSSPWRLTRQQWSMMAMWIVFAATLILRFVQTKDLALPAWVDSLHHTQIVDILRTQGRIPDVLMSYTPIPFYYHFGFHTLAAAIGELADVPTPSAILVLGQVLNAVVVLAIYRLTKTLTRSSTAALIAAALTGFVSQMPAYYVSWGRYTLLDGLILLMAALSLAVELQKSPRQQSIGPMLALIISGLILTHYLAAAYFSCFLVVLGIVTLLRRRLSLPDLGVAQLDSQAVVIWCGFGILLAMPWIVHAAPYILPFLSAQSGASSAEAVRAGFVDQLNFSLNLAYPLRTWPIVVFALGGAVLAIRRCHKILLLAVWLAALAAVSNEWFWRIWPFRADLLIYSSFVAVNILAAYALHRSWLFVRWSIPHPQLVRAIQMTVRLIFLVIGIAQTSSIVNPVTVLATLEDVQAASWIRANVQADARFLINVELWQGQLYRGTDGGWWLPLLSDRKTILPPGIFYGWGRGPQYLAEVADQAEQARIIDGCTPYFWYVLRKQKITHVYTSDRNGPMLSHWLNECAGLHRIYRNSTVSVYEVADDVASSDH
jgi:hypothetical protein